MDRAFDRFRRTVLAVTACALSIWLGGAAAAQTDGQADAARVANIQQTLSPRRTPQPRPFWVPWKSTRHLRQQQLYQSVVPAVYQGAEEPPLESYEEIEGQMVPSESPELFVHDGSIEQIPVGDGYCMDGGCPGDDCGSCYSLIGPGPLFEKCLVPFPILPKRNLSFLLGPHGFKGPGNQGADGSFGYQVGVNYGTRFPLFAETGLGAQIGYQYVSSNYTDTPFSENNRNQSFFTGGLFRRVDCGLQMGLVWDYMRDKWYYDNKISQLRGELSWRLPCRDQFGFTFTHHVGTDSSWSRFPNDQDVLESWAPTDQYRFFFSRMFETGIEGRFFAGFTGSKDGLLGAEAEFPLSDAWAIQAGFVSLIPHQSDLVPRSERESWNLAMSLVWYPGRTARDKAGNYYRPMFNVADNGTFLFHLK